MKTQKLVSWLMYIKSNSNTLMNLKKKKKKTDKARRDINPCNASVSSVEDIQYPGLRATIWRNHGFSPLIQTETVAPVVYTMKKQPRMTIVKSPYFTHRESATPFQCK